MGIEKLSLESGNEVHVWDGGNMVAQFPTDPTQPLLDILTAIRTKDWKKLISAVYTMTGYVLYLIEGQDSGAIAELRTAAQPIFDHIGANPQSVPPWLLPLLIHVLQDIQSLKNK